MESEFIRRKTFGETLVEMGLLTAEELEYHVAHNVCHYELGRKLVEEQKITEDQFYEALAREFDVKLYTLEDMEKAASKDALSLVSYDYAIENKIAPLKIAGKFFLVATCQPADLRVREQLSRMSDLKIRFVVARPYDVLHYVNEHRREMKKKQAASTTGDHHESRSHRHIAEGRADDNGYDRSPYMWSVLIRRKILPLLILLTGIWLIFFSNGRTDADRLSAAHRNFVEAIKRGSRIDMRQYISTLSPREALDEYLDKMGFSHSRIVDYRGIKLEELEDGTVMMTVEYDLVSPTTGHRTISGEERWVREGRHWKIIL